VRYVLLVLLLLGVRAALVLGLGLGHEGRLL